MIGALQGSSRGLFYPIAFGFECGDGWFDILLDCIQKLEVEINKMPEAEQEHVYATQIKEKFGTLRFYISCGTDKMHDITSEAEQKSENVCEMCGKPGKLYAEGWWYTSCPDHAADEDLAKNKI
jgi:hypothetical protein